MPDKLIIHLGDRKTGSTSIQNILFHKAWTSKTHSIIYPCSLNHIQLAKTLFQKDLLHKQAKAFEKIRKSLLRSDASIAILSAEDFEYVDPRLVESAIDTYFPEFKGNVEFIAYFRPHAARVLASYSERVKKGGFMGTPDNFFDVVAKKDTLFKETLFYAPRIKRWKNIFGDRYHARPMIPSTLRSNDVVHDFFSFALGDDDFQFTKSTRQNESVSLQDLAAFRYIHKKLKKLDSQSLLREQRKRLGAHLSLIMAQIPLKEPKKLKLHKQLGQKISAIYSKDAEELDANYFNGPVMQSALNNSIEKALDLPQSVNIKDHFMPETIRMIDCWIELNHRMMTANPSVYHPLIKYK